MSPWKAFRYRLEEAGCRVLAAAIPLLPRRGCVALAQGLGALAFRLDARGRAVAEENLRCVFGAKYSAEERRRMARESYQNFARTMLDLFWSSRLNERNWRRYIHARGFEEAIARLEGRKEGAMFYCIHQGNWEWASLAFGFLGLKTTIVAENFKNTRLSAIFHAQREVSGHTIIPQENSLLRLLKIVKRGGWTGMLIDLTLRPSQAATVIETFRPGGLLMCVPLLEAILAQRGGALLLPVESIPRRDGSCEVVVHPPVQIESSMTAAEAAEACWRALEPAVHARPGGYLWAYKHFRYKPKAAVRDYPAYANESGQFEKLLRKERRAG